MLAAPSVQAQVPNLLDEYYEELEQQSIQRDRHTMAVGRNLLSTTDRGFTINLSPVDNDDLTNGYFGEAEPEYPEVPLGSGLAILVGAGLGYVALKKKEDKQ